MMKILVEDVVLRLRVGNTIEEAIKVNIGVPQVDCLSPLLFIIYLADALNSMEHTCITTSQHITKHDYFKHNTNSLIIDQQYAVDVNWITKR